MLCIVGLGNPGGEYEQTRHNLGFMVLDTLAERARATISDKKFKARIGRARIAGEDCLLVKPQTYMNLSGESVGPALGFFKMKPSALIVIHDELDFEVGRIQLKKGGGHGGHNGLRSLKKHLPSDDFIRVRVGIGRPPPQWDPADWVLSRFSRDEHDTVDRAVSDAADAVESVIELGVAKAMARVNRSPKKKKKAPSEANDKGQGAPKKDLA